MIPYNGPMDAKEWELRGLPADLYESYLSWLLERDASSFFKCLAARDYEKARKREPKPGYSELQWRMIRVFFDTDMPRWCAGSWAMAKMWVQLSRQPFFELAIRSVQTGVAPRHAEWVDALHSMHDDPESAGPFVSLFAWSIPSHEVLTVLSSYPSIHDAFAATGWWAFLLASYKRVRPRQRLVTAADGYAEPHKLTGVRFGQWYPVKYSPASRRPMMSALTLAGWPDFMSESDLQLYRNIAPGRHIAYIGEGDGGAMGSPAGHKFLRENFDFVQSLEVPQWGGYRDRLDIYRRRAGRYE